MRYAATIPLDIADVAGRPARRSRAVRNQFEAEFVDQRFDKCATRGMDRFGEASLKKK